MNIEKVVKEKVNSLFVKQLISERGWSKAQAAEKVVDFLLSGTDKSFHDYMVDA